VNQQISSGIQIVVQLSRLPDGKRKIVSVSEVTGMEGDVITMQDIFVFERQGITEDGKVLGRFKATGIRPKFTDLMKTRGIEFDGALFLDVGGDLGSQKSNSRRGFRA